MSADLKYLARRWFHEWWNLRSESMIDEVTTPDCVAEVEGVDGVLTRDDLRHHRRRGSAPYRTFGRRYCTL